MQTEFQRHKNLPLRLKDAFRYWPVMLVSGVVVAILLTAISYAGQKKAYGNTLSESENELSDIDMTDIENVYLYLDTIAEYKEYQDNSVLIKMDANHVQAKYMEFNAPDSVSPAEMVNSINQRVLLKSFIEGLSDAAGVTLYDQDMQYLITAQVNGAGARYTVTIRYIDDMDVDSMCEYMKSSLEELGSSYIDQYDGETYSEGVLTAQKAVVASINDVQNRIDSILTVMSDNQKIYCLKYTDLPVNYTGTEQVEKVSASAPTIDKKIIIVGFVLGILLAYCIIVVYLLMRPVLIAPDILKAWFGVDVLCVYDRKENNLSETADKVYLNCVAKDINQVALFASDDTLELTKTISNMLNERGLRTIIVESEADIDNIKMAIDYKNAVLFEKVNNSKMKAIMNRMTELGQYNICCVGAVVEE